MKRDRTELDEPVEGTSALCCTCGIQIRPNPSMRCVQCLRAEVDITHGVARQVVMPFCKECGRYHRGTNVAPWAKAELESRELLSICLKRIKGFSGADKPKLVDAQFLYTEPHSKRLKVKLVIQKEVEQGAIIQQNMVTEFVVHGEQCDDCKKSYTAQTWAALVQVRQQIDHRRTFYYLEQLILKHEAHEKVLFLNETGDGLDFHFGHRAHARALVNFLQQHSILKVKESKQLVTHDSKSNTYNYKYTSFVDICQVCTDDLVYLPPHVANTIGGGAPQLMVCHRVASSISLVDPLTLKGLDMSNVTYWKHPVKSICNRRHLTKFMVLQVELVEPERSRPTQQRHNLSGRGRMQLADVELARVSDLGRNDDKVTVRCHLGHILKEGDHALGYDMRTVNVSGIDDGNAADFADRTDVYLVRKLWVKDPSRKRNRAWKLRRLAKERNEEVVLDSAKEARDMEDFKQDLEEDPDLRREVNLYRDPRGAADAEAQEQHRRARASNEERPENQAGASVGEMQEEVDEDEDERPEVPLAELLEGLTLEDELT